MASLNESRIQRLAAVVGDAACKPFTDTDITGVALDSRLVQPGFLYLAMRGQHSHGLLHLLSALDAGAVALAVEAGELSTYTDAAALVAKRHLPVVEITKLHEKAGELAARFYQHPADALKIVAVTGTDGKTSVCQFISAAINKLGSRCGYIGTIGWGLDEFQPTALTTPDVAVLQQQLAELRAAGAQVVALEASSIGIVEGRLNPVAVDIAVLTNFGRDHLDYHETLVKYRDAKARLFVWRTLHAVVVNGDDDLGAEIAGSWPLSTTNMAAPLLGPDSLPSQRLQRVVYGDAANDQDHARQNTNSLAGANLLQTSLHASKVKPGHNGLQFQLNTGAESIAVQSALIGNFNVDNLLACAGVLLVLGYSLQDCADALESLQPVPGRMERFVMPGTPLVVVDYAHTPQALEAAIAAVRPHCAGSLWVVFGCGGDRDPGKRAPMARAAEAADHVVITDDNPRTESSQRILDDIVEGLQQPDAAIVIAERRAAIAHAVDAANESDLVLVAGKGHEDYQIIGTERFDYSDRDTVRQLLEAAS